MKSSSIRTFTNLLYNPITWAIIVILFSSAYDIAFTLKIDFPATPATDSSIVLLVYIAVCWARKDSAKRRIYFPSDIIMLNFTINFPAYIFESRSWKGILALIGIAILYTVFSSLLYLLIISLAL